MEKAFTLIELLVVVLIIGILAALAVPQYQKAVEKSRAAQVISAVKSLYQSYVSYYLANGERPDRISELDMDFPWTGHYNYVSGKQESGTVSNEDWSLDLYHASDNLDGICGVRIKGPFAGGGFCIWYHIPISGAESVLNAGQLYCIERRVGAVALQGSNEGKYCNLFNATKKSEGNITAYALP